MTDFNTRIFAGKILYDTTTIYAGVKLMKKINLPLAVLVICITGTYALVANADNAWKKYHWDKSTADSLDYPLALGNNLTPLQDSIWDSSLLSSSDDWNKSVLLNRIVAGTGKDNCGPVAGGVEVCNGNYKNNGWLGIAYIWATRGKSNHIVQAVVKLNDYYFVGNRDHVDWRDYVMCQEIGHTFGLDHQDTNFTNANLGTCMDYTNDPDGTNLDTNNTAPNDHDYDMMTEIYAHLNSTDSGDDDGKGKGGGKKSKNAGDGAAIDLNNPSAWGQAIGQDASGQNNLFERNLSNGQVLVTHVLWAN